MPQFLLGAPLDKIVIGFSILTSSASAHALTARSPNSPVNAECSSYSSPEFACIHRYGSSLPMDFQRIVKNNISSPDIFPSTSVPSDPSFQDVAKATFLIWDEERAAEILGPNPSYDFMFTISEAGHEAPV